MLFFLGGRLLRDLVWGGLKEFSKTTYTILQVKCSFFMFLRILSNAAQFESCCKT
jgi:hypothetical protein